MLPTKPAAPVTKMRSLSGIVIQPTGPNWLQGFRHLLYWQPSGGISYNWLYRKYAREQGRRKFPMRGEGARPVTDIAVSGIASEAEARSPAQDGVFHPAHVVMDGH